MTAPAVIFKPNANGKAQWTRITLRMPVQQTQTDTGVKDVSEVLKGLLIAMFFPRELKRVAIGF